MANPDNADNGWSQLTRGAPLAVIVAAVLYILYQLLPVLELLAVAALIALILRTLLRLLQKLVKSQDIAVLLLIGLIVGFIVVLATIVVPSVTFESQKLLATLPTYLNRLTGDVGQLRQRFTFIPDISQALIQLRNLTNELLSGVPVFLGQAFSLTLELLATLILALYMAYDPNSLVKGILRLVPRRHHQRFKRILKACETRLRGWIFGTGIAMIFLGAGATFGLLILGIPSALPFGIIAGIFEIIPYFGSIIGTFLPALVALSISPLKLVFVLILFLVMNQIDAHIVQPLVMGQQVNIHPVMVIVTFLVMGKLFGFIGVLLAVPAAAVIITLIDEFTPKEPALEQVGIESRTDVKSNE
ncbi:AI-2E family transporter [Nostocaceae cyanobacterium CENA369]|uniref:AI-2E family transporter n=1 Tax=Dendronalium phyllosphericum CENA369 TaxID=1725256 RepID=A0A8J7I5Q9_9NOST|nr:AI-2E family transporter [Dendronalium phyllosphericum]MBH8574608.1 AI-2E family transporter [Dendronalium phyllosphericum CENA369]